MRKLITITVMVVMLALMAATAVDAHRTTSAYRMAYATYTEVTPFVYNHIYRDAIMDRKARVIWVKAARDNCINNRKSEDMRFYGPNSLFPFACMA